MIKKTLIILFFVLFALTISAHAVEWTVANQATVAWDAVTTTGSGATIPATDQVKYQVYIVKESANKTTAIKSGEETEALEHVITFPEEGRWLAGVKTIRIPEASPADIQESEITWSDNTDVARVPVPFGFIYFEPPAANTGFGPK